MKILHIITTITRGGAEGHLWELTRNQVLEGHAVTVAYLKGAPERQADFESAGIGVFDLGLRRYGDPAPLFRLRRLLARLRPDVVHAHMPPAELYARLALLGDSRTPYVVSKHNDERFFAGPGSVWLSRWAARRASSVIAISDAVRQYMVRRGVHRPARIVTIHYGMDAGPYRAVTPAETGALRAAWGVPPDTFLVGTVARLAPQKALHVLLEGFALYLKSAAVPARLAVVGRGPLEETLKAHAKKLGIESAVVWGGFRSDIPTVMKAFDAFALTSVYEGFGLVLLEAMAAGKPVVATQVSAIPEVVADGLTGILIPPGEPQALAAALSRLEVREERESLGARGLERALSVFDPGTMARKTMSRYSDAVRGGKAPAAIQ
jgi:glycosyltransferase involved in cell wall biosynthesis